MPAASHVAFSNRFPSVALSEKKNAISLRKSLAADWNLLFSNFACDRSRSDAAFRQWARDHSTPDRHYHDLAHVRQVLAAVRQVRSFCCNPTVVELAVWFHDVVCDARATDNERRSAEYAIAMLAYLQIPTAAIDEVTRLVLLTENHRTGGTDADGCVLLDADLSILGASQSDYRVYAENVRREYAWVPDDEYRSRRSQILKQFLQRSRIYRTDFFHKRLEAKARQNLGREIYFGF